MQNKIEFNAENHTYKIGNYEVPSVTTIISGKKTDIETAAMKMGTQLHKDIGIFLVGAGIEEDISDKTKFFIQKITDNLFVNENLNAKRFVELAASKEFNDFKVAGTCDYIIDNNGYRSVYDWKSGTKISKSHKLQIVAYMEIFECDEGKVWYSDNQEFNIKKTDKEYALFLQEFNILVNNFHELELFGEEQNSELDEKLDELYFYLQQEKETKDKIKSLKNDIQNNFDIKKSYKSHDLVNIVYVNKSFVTTRKPKSNYMEIFDKYDIKEEDIFDISNVEKSDSLQFRLKNK